MRACKGLAALVTSVLAGASMVGCGDVATDSVAQGPGHRSGWPAPNETQPPLAALPSRGAEIGAGMVVSSQARELADWIALTGDHAGAPFIIVDKMHASVFVFDANASLRAHSAVLLGLALGDDSVPGIGSRPMAQILPAERTTPAGRFVAEQGRNLQGEDVVWVDYDAAVSMHRVRTGNLLERRAERLATPTIDDNRISYGCINVPVAFYDSFIQPIFAVRNAMVYVLPDTQPFKAIFGIPQVALTGFDASGALPAKAHGGSDYSFAVSSALRVR